MPHDFSKYKQHIEKTENWFKEEISLLRTGRATPALIENVKVDYYGAKNPLKGMASIVIEDARTLCVKPWDSDAVIQIEQAIRASELGIQPVSETGTVRVIFPELTEERRKSLLKILAEKMEVAKISLRKEREESWREIQRRERDGDISEDDKFRLKNELQKMIDNAIQKLEELSSKKEKEIRG